MAAEQHVRRIGLAAAMTAALFASASVVPAGPRQDDRATSGAGQAWLEFSVPDLPKPDAFLVGYFADERSTRPAVTYRIPASAVARGDHGVVRLPLHGWSGASADVVVRVRTLSGNGPSDWSEPGGRLTAAELGSLQPAVKERGPAARPAARSSGAARAAARSTTRAQAVEAAFKADPTLQRALQARFPAVNLEAAIVGYERLDGFVAALVASELVDLPFEKLKPETVRAGAKLVTALKRLKPDVNFKAAARQANAEARQLVAAGRSAK